MNSSIDVSSGAFASFPLQLGNLQGELDKAIQARRKLGQVASRGLTQRKIQTS